MWNLKEKDNHTNLPDQQADKKWEINIPGYPLYPASEDIYDQYKEEKNINPEKISKIKNWSDNNKAGSIEKYFVENKSGSDLDVPGSELDDGQEKMGSEDEENNFYSLGGDDHKDLDEDKGGEQAYRYILMLHERIVK
jgi:hypothetical protein